MADEAQDVQTVEETTTTSSVDEKPSVETAESNQQAATDTVPVENRLAEYQRKYAKLENKLAEIEGKLKAPTDQAVAPDPKEEVVKQQLDKLLKDMGYVSKSDLEQKEADRQVAETMKSLESKYDGKNGLPKFDRSSVLEFAKENLIGNLEVAYKQMNEAAIMDARIKEALGKTRGVKSEVSDGSGSTNVGTTDDDLRSAAMQGDAEAKRLLIKRAIS